MTSNTTWRIAGSAAVMAVGASGPALAASPQVNAGDTAWLMLSTVLVLLMAIPGLSLFYSGLVRNKNTLSILAQVFSIVCVVALMWVAFGYTFTYTGGSQAAFLGGTSKLFLWGVTVDSTVPTRFNGIDVPEFAFVGFQMMFACITPALMVGAFAERMRFAALLVFIVLWVTLVYFPIAHMAWYWSGPDALAEAARAVAQAPTATARRSAEAALMATKENAGLFGQWGAIDFAGGIVVHVSAGIAGLVGAIILGPRAGYGRVSMAPNSLVLTMVGGALLWVGWFGFNAGSGLRADGTAALAGINTIVAAAAAALSWMGAEWLVRGKPSLLGMVSGALAGLVAVTPAAGYSSPVGAIALGLVSGAACLWFVTSFKSLFNYDDALDVFGLHCIAGVIGSIAVAFLANPAFGGTGLLDYVVRPGLGTISVYEVGPQFWAQVKAVVVTLLWSGFITAQLLKLVDFAIGLRPAEFEEQVGLDISDHGERSYN